jgi:HK97 gp10 family phage protein
MAKCTAKLPEDLLKKLSRVGDNMDKIAESALTAGGDVVLRKTKSNLESMVKGPSTGQLVSALGLSPVLLDRNGNYNIKVGFDEYRSDGSANAMVANIIEYGKHGQPAKPFLKNAKSSSKKECEETMARKIEEEIKKL